MTTLRFSALVLAALTVISSVSAQFGGSDPSLAGPYFVRSQDGRMCIYYRIRNFAIRGYNTQQTTARTAAECARLCNDQAWCNSFEYSTDGRCFVNANDIYVPDTITAWNTAFEWDYWQLRDCLPAESDAAKNAAGNAAAAAPPPEGGVVNGDGGQDAMQNNNNESDGNNNNNSPFLLHDSVLPLPSSPNNRRPQTINQQNGVGGTDAAASVIGGEGRGAQRVQGGAQVENVEGFPSVSNTPPPMADKNGARKINKKTQVSS